MSFKLSNLDLSRTVFLFDQFWQDTAEDLINDLLALDAESNEDIYIVINSFGGSVYSLLSIIDTIKNLKSKVNTICLGIAASAGAVLFVLGNKRYIGENSKLMIHQVSSVLWGTTQELENELEEVKSLNENLFNMVLKKSNLSEDEMKKIFNKDSYLDAETVVSYALADEIIEEAEEDTDNQNVYYNSEVKNFISSFEGFSKDGAYAVAMASNVAKSRKKALKNSMNLLSQIKNSVSKNQKKGEKAMDLKELKQMLKSEHSIDLDAMTTEISDLKTAVTDRENTIQQLTEEKENLIQKYQNEKIDNSSV